ncbi:MAG: MFS transporter [Acidimicrobiales bacterium]
MTVTTGPPPPASTGLAVAAGAFGSLDSALNVAFPDLVADFDLAVGQLQWVVICFVLVSGGLLLPAGALGDAIGHARLALLGASCSVVALVACAAAPSFGWFLAARVGQGVGTAAVMASAPALAALAAPRRELAAGRFQAAAAVGLAIGPVVGGVLVLAAGWRAVFWFRVPLAVALVLLALLVGHRGAGRPSADRAAADRRGAALVAVTVAAVLGAVSARTAGPVALVAATVMAALAIAAFAAHARSRPDPIVDPGLLRQPIVAAAAVATLVVNGALFAIWLLVPSLLVDRFGLHVVAAGGVLAVSPVATAAAAGRASVVTDRIGPTATMGVGVTLAAGGLAVLAATAATGPAIVGLAVAGVGLGLFSVPAMAVILDAMPEGRQGVAGALSLMMRTLGIVTGVAVQGDLFDRIELGSGFATAYRAVMTGSASTLAMVAAVVVVVAVRSRRPMMA